MVAYVFADVCVCVYTYVRSAVLSKTFKLFFWEIDFFYLSDYDYEMALAAGIGGWELCER